MMARLQSAALHTLWILFFSYTANEVTAAGHVQEFACFTDYDKELFCQWKVPAQTNCSKEFLLYYREEILFLSNGVCVPENGKDSLRCTCTIHADYFVSGLTYILALQFNGTDMWNYSVTPALVVKPRAPKNLVIEKAENGNFNLSWEESNSALSTFSGVIYEVKYWRKQHPKEVSVKAINYQAKSFEIIASSLRRGYDYVASVRCNYTEYPAYWSEWSEEVEFHYDYQVTAEDILQMAVPVSCILIMAVSVICYFCFTKVKKEWWDQIPNPAKSHLVVENVKFSVLCYIDEIKFPFHDLKQSHTENQISCKNCLAQSLSSQNFKEKDNIRNVEKSCSCHSRSGAWFPKSSSEVLTPETILVEESIEIFTMFEPCESGVSAFREHTEHNDALASMFIDLLTDENNMQDSKDPDIITGENKTFEKLELENPSQRKPKESAAQSQQPCDLSHTVSLFTKASQDDYNCSTASQKSELSEESFESGYQSSSVNSASLDARDLQHMVHQSLFPCSSESQHDSCVLIQESPNKPSFGTKNDRISNPAHKSFDTLVFSSMGLCSSAYKSCDTLMSPSLEPCGSAYKRYDSVIPPSMEPCGSADKSCDTLLSPSMEPCGSPYKSFDTLVSASMEPCGSAYKSCDALVSPSVEPCGSAYKSFDFLVPAFKEPSSSAYKSFDALMSQSMANSSLTLCFENVCSLPPLTQFSETHANDSASAFLSEEEIHKQVIYQNIQKKPDVISCPIGPQPCGYQPFDNAVRCNGTYCNNDSELSSDSKDENTSRDEQLLHLLELNCTDCNSRERSVTETKPNSFDCTGKGMQESSSNRLNTDFQCHTHNHLRKLGNAGENREVIKHAVGRRCGSAATLQLDSIGLNLERRTAEPLELLVSDKFSPPPFVDDSCPSDSHTIHSAGSRMAPAVKKRPVELLRENNRKNEEKMKLVQALAQEDHCYMKVA
ncbi:PREDICTED: interleukin-4 receptor subunit alpha [Chlamydotis macqueenii]|nr:PREDICTED: interleukin-4 receptor subunit alpha [Chlamydotis macqueenii]